MKFFHTSTIRELDAYTIEHEPIASIDLMERAARVLTDTVLERFGGCRFADAVLRSSRGLATTVATALP